MYEACRKAVAVWWVAKNCLFLDEWSAPWSHGSRRSRFSVELCASGERWPVEIDSPLIRLFWRRRNTRACLALWQNAGVVLIWRHVNVQDHLNSQIQFASARWQRHLALLLLPTKANNGFRPAQYLFTVWNQSSRFSKLCKLVMSYTSRTIYRRNKRSTWEREKGSKEYWHRRRRCICLTWHRPRFARQHRWQPGWYCTSLVNSSHRVWTHLLASHVTYASDWYVSSNNQFPAFDCNHDWMNLLKTVQWSMSKESDDQQNNTPSTALPCPNFRRPQARFSLVFHRFLLRNQTSVLSTEIIHGQGRPALLALSEEFLLRTLDELSWIAKQRKTAIRCSLPRRWPQYESSDISFRKDRRVEVVSHQQDEHKWYRHRQLELEGARALSLQHVSSSSSCKVKSKP